MFEKRLRKLEQDIVFNANKIYNIQRDISVLSKLKECYKCGGYFNENNLTKVELENVSYVIPRKEERLYCRNCKPDYCKIVYTNKGETKYKLTKVK